MDPQSAPDNYSKCACTNCGGRIEFPTKGAGATITCPHCNWPTILSFPQSAQSPPDTQHTPAVVGGPEPNRRKQIFLLAAVGAILVAAAAFCIIRYAPNFTKTLITAASKLKQSGPNNAESLPPPGTNRAFARGVSTNKNARELAALPASPPKPDPWHGLTAGAITLEKSQDGGLVYAIGKLHNDTDRQRFGVKVILDLFDESNRKVGTATDYTQLIDPGKEWKFKAMVTDRNAVRASLASVAEQ